MEAILSTTMKAPSRSCQQPLDWPWQIFSLILAIWPFRKFEIRDETYVSEKHWTPLSLSEIVMHLRLDSILWDVINREALDINIFFRPHESCHDNLCTLHPFPRSILVCDYITQKRWNTFSHGMQDDTRLLTSVIRDKRIFFLNRDVGY